MTLSSERTPITRRGTERIGGDSPNSAVRRGGFQQEPECSHIVPVMPFSTGQTSTRAGMRAKRGEKVCGERPSSGGSSDEQSDSEEECRGAGGSRWEDGEKDPADVAVPLKRTSVP